ncbi:hypothetical protein CN094_35935, partial [Sinorhizobium meliloti]
MIFYGSGKNSASKTSDGRPSHYDRFLHVSCPYPNKVCATASPFELLPRAAPIPPPSAKPEYF